ncbi:polyphosphate kinase 1 [Alienimonas californiensis]|uniref:Polyphosphate kinase n=1 Tax=Alienimonas californiensis TaxID=2527989 RepID=A0A517P6I8_9PLAN|nr:polyphosphate kinase 1 [Alienimonas californiensis]QDT14989.1 Polyphosphate kinase [Alienimonas californiensis]
MSPEHFLNRELSWLEFNQRVLDEAADPLVPPLERLKFLAITGTNLDEFFMVRVGGLQMLAEEGREDADGWDGQGDDDEAGALYDEDLAGSVPGAPPGTDPAGMTPEQQLAAIAERCSRMSADQYALLAELDELLAGHGFVRPNPAKLTSHQATALDHAFREALFGVLTPTSVTGPEDFPLVETGAVCVLVRLAPAAAEEEADHPVIKAAANALSEGGPRFAVIPCGRAVPRWLTLPTDVTPADAKPASAPAPGSHEGGRAFAYLPVEEAVAHLAGRFFEGQTVEETVAFRVTRNADLAIREDQAGDLLRQMRRVLEKRRRTGCVRLELAAGASEAATAFLTHCLDVAGQDVYTAPGPVGLGALMKVTGAAGFDDLRIDDWPPQPPPRLEGEEPSFDALAANDVLLYHPYDSYEPVVRLAEEAAEDPDVLAIKQTLYRTSADSRIVAALKTAAREGKSVTAVVELKARFDEARNIEWARDLERAGVQVIYGVRGLKTHAKLLLVIRREPDGVRRYAHFGTGNYNESTARIYSDASLMTADEDLTADAVNFFNAVTGYSQPQAFRRIEAAPIGMRERLAELIGAEADRARQGVPAGIDAKMNSLVDPALIDALYDASAAGVKIRLNVRGICCLRPGVEGVSENIQVVSVVDRFLEHARVMRFVHGGDELMYLSSADWMPRNLDRRIELLVPITAEPLKRRMRETMALYFRDNVKARELHADGVWRKVNRRGRKIRSQRVLYEEAVSRAERLRPTVFEPHRAPGKQDE